MKAPTSVHNNPDACVHFMIPNCFGPQVLHSEVFSNWYEIRILERMFGNMFIPCSYCMITHLVAKGFDRKNTSFFQFCIA